MVAPHVTLSIAELDSLRETRAIIPVDAAVFHVTGPGTISCLQGLHTNDITKLPDGAAAWGAFLTPKGMIITDAWVIRDGESAWIVVPGMARCDDAGAFCAHHAAARSPRLPTAATWCRCAG